jgi:hypothetical protein
MRTYWLLSSLALVLTLTRFAAAKDGDAVPPPPGAGELPSPAAGPEAPGRPAAGSPESPPELVPPGTSAARPALEVRAPVKPPQLHWPSRPVSVLDVVVMTHNRVGDAAIMDFVRQNGVERPLAAPDLVMLHKEGVSDAVMIALQQAAVPVAPLAAPIPPSVVVVPPPVYPRPVVIPEYRYVVPPPVRYYYGPRYPYHGPHWGMSIYLH